jgi:hypothetical protein
MPNEETIQKMSIVDPIQVNINIPNFEGKPGRDGVDGRDGDDAYRIAVRNGFLGTEKEWLLTLKGQDGKSASAPTARQALLKNNIWCEDDTVDSVFTAMIGNWGKPMPRTEFKPLTIPVNLTQGQRIVAVTGEPHYKVKLQSSDTVTQLNDNGTGSITLETPFGEDDIKILYLNFVNEVLDTKTIQGVSVDGTPDDTDVQGDVKYSLKGRVLTVNLSSVGTMNRPKVSFLGKFKVSQIDSIILKVNNPAEFYVDGSKCVMDSTGVYGESIPVYVNQPENLHILNTDHYGSINIGTLEHGTKTVGFVSSSINWYANKNEFLNDGEAIDHL